MDKTLKSTLTSASQYKIRSRYKLLFLLLVVGLLLFSFVLDLIIGPGNYPISEVFQIIFDKNEVSSQQEFIIWGLRVPIAVMAILVGCMLGAAGAEMQTILNNPLADPFTLGISSAASFGAALAIVFIPGTLLAANISVTLSAFLFALLTSFLLYLFTLLRGANNETMILIGIALLFTFNALLGLLQFSANDVELVQIVFWMMGSLSRANWGSISICFAVLVVVIPYIMYRSWPLTALRMGEDKAESLGINVKRLRIEMLIAVSLLAATAVSFVGTIGFVGLVGPHIARLLVGEDQRYFLPLSMLSGALMMSLTSIVSKSISPGAIYPIGIITSLIGIPLFIGLILTIKRRNWQ